MGWCERRLTGYRRQFRWSNLFIGVFGERVEGRGKGRVTLGAMGKFLQRRFPFRGGDFPFAAGRVPSALGCIPLTAGCFPLAVGCFPLAAGDVPLAGGWLIWPPRGWGSPVADARPPLVAGQPESRTYLVLFLDGNDVVGDPSDEMTVVTRPL